MLHKVPTKPPPTPPTKSTQPGNADPPVPQAGSPSLSSGPSAAISIFNVKCAACHESKVAASNGKGFTLLNGMQVANLTDAQKKKIAVKTYRGEMPKQPNKFNIPPLTDEEVGAIMAWLN